MLEFACIYCKQAVNIFAAGTKFGLNLFLQSFFSYAFIIENDILFCFTWLLEMGCH